MKLKFKEGSKVQKTVIELYEKKENAHKQAIQIIEEVTGCKTLETARLGYSWCFDWNYSYLFDRVFFDKELIEVPGYKYEVDKNGNNHHLINRRKKTIYNKLRERFQKEVPDTSIKQLNVFGIENRVQFDSYHWLLDKDEAGDIVLYINPKMYDLLDFTKSIENGEQTITVEQ